MTKLRAFEEWYCPNCGQRDRITPDARPHTRYHTCPRLHMLSAPMVRDGTKAKVEIKRREDYLNGDIQQTDTDGRPVMGIVTTRDEGTDALVFAPPARMRAG